MIDFSEVTATCIFLYYLLESTNVLKRTITDTDVFRQSLYVYGCMLHIVLQYRKQHAPVAINSH